MALNVHLTIQRGGRPLIDLLEFCVISINMDAVFLFLVKEYQVSPATERAAALYDVFCAPAAPARLQLEPHLPPKNPRIRQALAPYLAAREHLSSGEAASDEEGPTNWMLLPPKYLFDFLADALRDARGGDPLEEIGRTYDPELSPVENLPGGKMSSAQKFFTEYVWGPQVRPRLTAAGFRRIANVA